MIFFLKTWIGEYRAILKDKGALLIFIAGLMVYALFYPLPYTPEVLRDIKVVPVNEDHSQLSRKLMQWVEASEQVRFIDPVHDLAEARQQVARRKAEGIFLIPEGFERDILRGDQATVALYADTCSFLTYVQIYTGVYSATATLSAGVEIKRHTAHGLGLEHAMDARDPMPTVSRALFNPVGGYMTYVVPAVLVLIIQQTLLIGIGMLGGTRNEGLTPDVARTKGVSKLAVLLARTLAYFSIYICYPICYRYFIYSIYGLPKVGLLVDIMIFMTPYVLAVTLLGLALCSILPSRELSIPAIIFTSIPAVFFVGFAFPADAMPQWIYYFGLLLPSSTGVAGFLKLSQMHASLNEVMFEWCVLWALCLFYLLLAWLGMRFPSKAAAEQTDPQNA